MPVARYTILSLLTAAALTGASACSRSQAADPRLEAPLVRVAVAVPAEARSQSFTGTVSARVQSDLGFRIAGKVVERLVDTGQTVRKGQPLMRIDPTDYTLAVTAQAGSVDAARAKAEQTAADERRYRDLVSAGAVSASAYDQVKAAAEAAKAQLAAAEAQARVARDQAGYAILTADADGVVVQTLAEPGQVVAAGQTVVRLAHAGPREAAVDLPETVRPAIGSEAQASLFSDPGLGGGARLRQLSDAADPQTRTYEARYILEGPAAAAPLGATVEIRIPATAGSAAAAVQAPLSAIWDSGGGPGVWIIDPATSTLAFRPVKLGGVGAETVTVTAGLRPGERFVAMGAQMLRRDERVRIDTQLASAQ